MKEQRAKDGKVYGGMFGESHAVIPRARNKLPRQLLPVNPKSETALSPDILLLHFTGPPVPRTARVHSTPQSLNPTIFQGFSRVGAKSAFRSPI
eukprot:422263-Pyramimonas_sp.AAC.1